MRLDHFLPFNRKDKGSFRKLLRCLGPSWEYAPLRRGVQTLCLIAFCTLFFYVCWPYSAVPEPNPQGWPSHYFDDFRRKGGGAAELFLALDPLVSISTAIAGRMWIWSLSWAAILLGICILIPRGFCSYVCPLGSLIDLFDRIIGGRVRVKQDGWWVHLKYYILISVLVSAGFGVLLSGYVAAIPVLTRGCQFILAPLQMGLMRGWHQVPPWGIGQLVSILLFAAIFLFGLLRPRFWCRYLCPSGAVFSISNLLFRVNERKVGSECTGCGRCAKVCPFDAVYPDYSTRPADCAFCQTCGGACSQTGIRFVSRTDTRDLKPCEPAGDRPFSRRAFIGGTGAGALLALGAERTLGDADSLPIRPPMSLPEREFLRTCIRCGACFTVCPNNVLQPMGFEQGIDGLWTPMVAANWSGCEPSCANCAQVCPTGAIRNLPLAEKRVARIGLAVLNKKNCLPFANKEACQLCADECTRAGYNAIEFERVHPQIDEDGMLIDGSGYLAPVVVAHKCVGCGLCQSICYRIKVKAEKLLDEAAIVLRAGPDREDRIIEGLYTTLRQEEEAARERGLKQRNKDIGDFY